MGPRRREWGVVVCRRHRSWGPLVELVECGGGRMSPLMGGGDEPSLLLVGSGGGPSPLFALPHCLACRCPACPCPCVPSSLRALILSCPRPCVPSSLHGLVLACPRYRPSLSSSTLLVLVDPHRLHLVCDCQAVSSFLGCVIVVRQKRRMMNPHVTVGSVEPGIHVSKL
jgi:hypothetical protein